MVWVSDTQVFVGDPWHPWLRFFRDFFGWFGLVASFSCTTWMFPKIVVPQNGWFIMENLIKMDDLGVPPFKETSTSIHKVAEFDWTQLEPKRSRVH